MSGLHISPPLFRQVDRTFLYDHGVTNWVREQEMVKEMKLGRNTRETRKDGHERTRRMKGASVTPSEVQDLGMLLIPKV